VRAAALLASTMLAAFLAGVAPAAGQSVQDRIQQGLEAAGEAPTITSLPEADQVGITATPDEPAAADVSLAPSSDTSRLRTTLDPTGIEQRIDKGLTAAGEDSAFPPDYAYGAFQRGWFLTAFSLALERAEKGDAVAETLLGVILSRGLGVKQDLAAAADWYRLAGEGGDPEGLYALGQFYLHGHGVEKDPAKAAELFRKAADMGHAAAARELAYLLLEGEGEEKNAMLAAAYLSRAARLGNMDAQYTLAGLFMEGVGVVRDDAQAARWYKEAARNGHVGAQVEYAILLFNGQGVEKNEAQAADWFRRAANADNPLAQVRLARLLADGRGVPKDEAEAARWYLIAKARGVDDDSMEEWLQKLDPEIREAAKADADAWTQARRGWTQAAVQPAERPAPVDNALE
jgi:TPR repeat protein